MTTRRQIRWWGAPTLGLVIALGTVACGGSADPASRDVGTAPPLESATSAFCTDLGASIQVLDRYGRVFSEPDLTVGQLQAAAAEVTAAHDQIVASATQLSASITAANRASAATSGSASTTTTILANRSAEDHLAAITAAEETLDETIRDIEPTTSVRDAAVDLHAAAFGVEQTYVALFVDAGCLPDDAAAVRTLNRYVEALQTDLGALGYYTGAVDGVYGPATVTAISALQASAGLAETGIVDPATEAALLEQLTAKDEQSSLSIAGLQGALTVTGDYDGPVDGLWSPAVESALVSYQVSQGLPGTGAVDTETLAALLRAGDAASGSTTTTTGPPGSSPPSTPATTGA